MILVVGVAGSGKSTQSRMLADAEGWYWISIGQLLRKSLTNELADEMNTGRLISDDKVQNILGLELRRIAEHAHVVLDGFPRRLAQARWLFDVARDIGDPIEAVVHLNAHENIVLERLLSRGRSDDKPDAINERFLEYERDIKPILSLLSEKGIPIVQVDGEQSPEDVQIDIRAGLEEVGIKL